MSDTTRKHEIAIEIAASPDDVWDAVATAEGVASWFAPVAKVEPGQGGSVTFSWGGGMEGTGRIDVWEPGKHLQVVNDRAPGEPPSVVDYFIEGTGGTTTMRLVHSGFGASASFDGEFESTGRAWPVFLQMMKHSVERGIGACRNVTLFSMLSGTRAEAWAAMRGPGGIDALCRDGVVRHFDATGLCCVEFPKPKDAMLAVFCESCGGSAMLTLTWLLYGATEEQANAVRGQWSATIDALLGSPNTAEPAG